MLKMMQSNSEMFLNFLTKHGIFIFLTFRIQRTRKSQAKYCPHASNFCLNEKWYLCVAQTVLFSRIVKRTFQPFRILLRTTQVPTNHVWNTFVYWCGKVWVLWRIYYNFYTVTYLAGMEIPYTRWQKTIISSD